jgi:threonine dehydrogenase-like Zn-dependent dehydrogenase
MRALVKQEPAPGLVMTEVPEPEIGINDVLIRVDRTGICGTDLHIADWNEWAQQTVPVPLVIGHEFVGEIVEVGSNVSDFHPGDLVSGTRRRDGVIGGDRGRLDQELHRRRMEALPCSPSRDSLDTS